MSKGQILGMVCAISFAVVIGCGGGGTANPGLTGGSTGGDFFTREEGATARIDVDTINNTATITPLGPSTRAVFGGNTVSVTAAEVFNVPGGSTTSRIMRLTFRNNSAIALGTNSGLYAAISTATPGLSASTIAGTGVAGNTNGAVASAQLGTPNGVWEDADGTIYFTQTTGGAVRRIRNGTVTTLASGYNLPFGITGDPSSDWLYVVERGAHRVLRLRKDGLVGSVIAGNGTPGDAVGAGATARFNVPIGITRDVSGDLHVTDFTNNKIKKIVSPNTAPTTSVLVNGVNGPYGISAGLIQGRSVVAYSSTPTGQIFIADPTAGVPTLIRTLANSVTGVAVVFDRVVVSNVSAHTVTSLAVGTGSNPFNIASWSQEAVFGGVGYADGTTSARFSSPLLLDGGVNSGVLLADSGNHRLRRIVLPNFTGGTSSQPVVFSNSDGTMSTGAAVFALAGDGSGLPTDLDPGSTLTKDVSFNIQFGATMTFYVTVSGGTVGPIAIDGAKNANAKNVFARRIAGDPGTNGYIDGIGADALFANIQGTAVADNGLVFVADGNRLRIITKESHVTTIGNLSGALTLTDGNGYQFTSPTLFSVATNEDGTLVYIGTNTNIIRATRSAFSDPTNPASWTFAHCIGDPLSGGDADGLGPLAEFNGVQQLVIDRVSNKVYFVASGNHKVKVATQVGSDPMSLSSWRVDTLAGGAVGFADGAGAGAQFNNPYGIAQMADGSFAVGDNGNLRLRRVTKGGSVTTLSGDGISGTGDDTLGRFGAIRWLASDESGSVYLYDNFFLRVFRNNQMYTISTAFGVANGYVDGGNNIGIGRISVNRKTGELYGTPGSTTIVKFEQVTP